MKTLHKIVYELLPMNGMLVEDLIDSEWIATNSNNIESTKLSFLTSKGLSIEHFKNIQVIKSMNNFFN